MFILTGLSVHGAININYFKMNKDDFKQFIGNCLFILNSSAILILILALILMPILKSIVSLDAEFIILSIILAYAHFFTIINLTLWLVEQKPIPYSIYQISQTIVTTSLTLIFIVHYNMNWKGQVYGLSIGTIIFSISSFIFLLKRGYVKFKYKYEYIKDALHFGIPLLPHSLSGWLKSGADRIIINFILGASLTGIYSISYQIGSVILVVITAFSKAWSPFILKELSSHLSFFRQKEIVNITYKILVGILALSIIYSFIAVFLFPYLFDTSYNEVTKYILYFSISFGFQGMFLMIGDYIFYTNSTMILSKISMLTSFLYIVLVYFLIKIMGVEGVAISNLIVSIVNFVALWYVSNKVYPMPWFRKE